MSTPLSTKRIVSLSLALSLAVPLTAGAKEMPRLLDPTRIATDYTIGGVPASITKFKAPDGRDAYVAIGMMDDDTLKKQLPQLTKAYAGHLTIGVGQNDPMVDVARDAGLTTKSVVELTDDITKIPAFKKEKDQSLKNRVLAKISLMKEQVVTKRWNTIAAFGYAGSVSVGEVFIVSGQVSNTVGMFVPLAAFSLFTATQDDWKNFMRGAANTGVTVVAAAMKAAGVAREMTTLERRVVKGTAQFAVTWALSAAEFTAVHYASGLPMDPMHIGFASFGMSYAAADAVVIRWLDQHIITHRQEIAWFLAQYVLGTAAVLSMYNHVEWVSTALTTFTASTLVYMGVGEYVEESVRKTASVIKYVWDNGLMKVLSEGTTPLKRRMAAARRARKLASGIARASCNDMLISNAPRSPWMPSPWRIQSIQSVN